MLLMYKAVELFLLVFFFFFFFFLWGGGGLNVLPYYLYTFVHIPFRIFAPELIQKAA